MTCPFCSKPITVKQIVNGNDSLSTACCKNILSLYVNRKLNLDIADITHTVNGETKVYPEVL